MLPIVAGIVANLINNGMHKVADEVVEKGVDAVQSKLGMELKPEGEATPEYNAKLQEEANRHSEFMAELDEKSTQRATDMYMKDEGTRKFSQQYGRFEARIKLPIGQGYWPAFWMMGVVGKNVGGAVALVHIQVNDRHPQGLRHRGLWAWS